jgi:ubiquinone/menaquinone biosynthesis C-methylase UbiE
MSEMLTLKGIKKSSIGRLLRKCARPILPGWVDSGRKIVQGPHLRKMLQRVMRESHRVNNILNAGAGEGLYSDILLAFPGRGQVLELDASYNQCFRTSGEDLRQRFLAASLTEIPLVDQTIDLILCSEVLEHIQEDEAALNELTRVLSPGGWLLISVPTPPAVFDRAHVREGYYLNDLSRRLTMRGLEVVEVRFCMHAVFRLFLKSYRQGVFPRGVVFILAWLDRGFPLSQPMDLMILSRKGVDN